MHVVILMTRVHHKAEEEEEEEEEEEQEEDEEDEEEREGLGEEGLERGEGRKVNVRTKAQYKRRQREAGEGEHS